MIIDRDLIEQVVTRNLTNRVLTRLLAVDRDFFVDTLVECAGTVDLVEALKIQLCVKEDQASLSELVTALKAFMSTILHDG